MADKGKIKTDYKDVLQGASFSFAGMNFMVDPADLPISDGQCVDICNCDVDYKNNISRRNGYTRILTNDISTAWGNGSFTYAVISGTLCYILFNIDQTLANAYPIIGVPELYGLVEFKQANNIVVFSDSLTIGILDGITATIFDKPIFEV